MVTREQQALVNAAFPECRAEMEDYLERGVEVVIYLQNECGDREIAMRQVMFQEVQVGAQFKETPDGAWHLKTDNARGLWRANGMESSPQFRPVEMVWID